MEIYSEDEYCLVSPSFLEDFRAPNAIEQRTGKRLEVNVIFTDTPGTLAALKMADGFAQQLEAHVRLLVPHEVPYALPLARPAVPVDFLEDQIRNLADKIHLEISAQIYLCRDKRRALSILMRPHSLVVVGGKKRWWSTAAQGLAKAMRRAGHQVIFAKVR